MIGVVLAALSTFVVPSAPPPAHLMLTWDVDHARPAVDTTNVYVSTDGKFLYVKFVAEQKETIVATQHADDTVTGGSNINGGIAWSDDAVWVDLWPKGPAGFQYQFEANPNGAHNESSTENVSYAPHWESHGERTPDGYTVTMAIPFAVIHGAHEGMWRLQFVRYVRTTGDLDVWSYDPAQTNPDDAARAGNANFTSVAKPPLPKPRVAPYALGEAASKTIGGSTSRIGMDFSIPVAQTASFFGTLHPDYSNVELDQVSISPTVFQRTYNEVRPFFTQAAGYFNNFNCNVCNGFRTTLYTFAIPTPREGYAFEGREGNFGLAAFDAIGDDRTDAAAALNFTSTDTRWNAAFQHVIADLPGLTDATNMGGLSWWNGKYLYLYANDATESGTLVTSPSQGQWLDTGGAYINQKWIAALAYRSVGSQFDPVDGFDSHPGIDGYATFVGRIWTFAKQDALASAGISALVDRYQGEAYGSAQSDNGLLLDMLTKGTWDLQLSSGSDYWRFGDALTPISQQAGVSLTYHSGMQNNVNNFPSHGSSATPTQIQYYTGRYGLGRLDTWYRSTTMRVGQRGYLTFAIDNTSQWLREYGPDNIQWFDSVSYSYQVDRNSSFAVGVRKVTGLPPEPNGGGDCEATCANVSIAYHLRLRDYEIYAAYGDPNTLTTVPQMIFKVIFYAGAQKGT
ncbi:MAG TPA: hypothetical protein VMA98_07395 [Candidatus Acidoferrales bacterium]|nr:hypothetical protein [Candidatus Acidoferrales bacterium]